MKTFYWSDILLGLSSVIGLKVFNTEKIIGGEKRKKRDSTIKIRKTNESNPKRQKIFKYDATEVDSIFNHGALRPPTNFYPHTPTWTLPTPPPVVDPVEFKYAEFNYSAENFLNFKRLTKNENDCVISAFQFLSIIDNNIAELSRKNNTGSVNIKTIEDIFKLHFKNNNWKFEEACECEIENYINKEMSDNTVIFCGYEIDSFRHVFLIGKENGILFLFDPQVCKNLICNLSLPECLKNIQGKNYVKGKNSYFILKYSGEDGQIGKR